LTEMPGSDHLVTCGTYRCAEEREALPEGGGRYRRGEKLVQGCTTFDGQRPTSNDPTYPLATRQEALLSCKVACYKICALPLIDVQHNIAANLKRAAEHPHLVNRPRIPTTKLLGSHFEGSSDTNRLPTSDTFRSG
jgi:hypothetical protein